MLTLNADGSYGYELDSTNPVVNALKDGDVLTESFVYTITDADGDSTTATLTVTITGVTDGPPAITPADGNGATSGHNSVHEAGLGDAADGSEVVTGTIAVSALDGLTAVEIGGVVVTPAQLAAAGTTPVVVTTAKGTLTITGFTPAGDVGGVPTGGTISYAYELAAPQDHQAGAVTDDIPLAVTDAGGGRSTGVLTIDIVDDTPSAASDAASIAEGAVAPVTGNVFANGGAGDLPDAIGADGAGLAGPVTAVGFGGAAGTIGSPLTASYGVLTLNADGSYAYALDNGNPAVNALKDGETLTETFTYAITDADGDSAMATLTITITGVTDGAPAITPVDANGAAGGHNTVFESGLGSATDAGENTAGTITVAAPDGLATIEIGGIVVTAAQLADAGTSPIVINTGKGTLTVTGFTPTGAVGGVPTGGSVSYTYELAAGQDHGAGSVSDDIALVVTDAGAGRSTGVLTIDIIDDVPVARNDAATITEGAASPVTGNVFSGGGAGDAADAIGGDGAGPAGPVTAVSFGGSAGLVGFPLAAGYGALTLNADGSYSYLLDNGNPAVNALKDGETLTEVFVYAITDADGDSATATLTITITGVTDGAPVITPVDGNGISTGQTTVYEAGLGAPTDQSERGTGAITVSAGDGLASVEIGGVVLTPAQLADAGTTPIVITTPKGTLVITGFTPSGAVGGVPTGGVISYDYELASPQDHGPGPVTDVLVLKVTDTGGDVSSGTLTIDIVDDAPLATDDAASLTRGDYGSTSTIQGNILAGDAEGRGTDSAGGDGPAAGGLLSSARFGDMPVVLGEVFATSYGKLTLNPDGSYVYELDNSNPDVSRLPGGQELTEVVSYAITDADGDVSYATLTISIHGRNDGSANTDAAFASLDTPWPALRNAEAGWVGYLEGRPVDVYTTAFEVASQQALFRQTGAGLPGSLSYEATLGRWQSLPSWISFEASTQTVTARPTDETPPGIYVVRVMARDADGNEAESSVTFHVLRSLDKSLEVVRGPDRDADGPPRKRGHWSAPPADAPPAPAKGQGAPEGDAPAGRNEPGDTPPGARRHDGADGAALPSMGASPTLSGALLHAGSVGQMIEAARFLEALASLDQSNS